VNLVIDVGANTGQYASALRHDGYRGQIVSFEPQPSAAAELRAAAAGDQDWKIFECALGPAPGKSNLFVTDDSQSSSLLAPSADPARFRFLVGSSQTPVEIATLDDFRFGHRGHNRLYLKLDVQGYELGVLRGAPKTLRRAAAVECELSLTSLYTGQAMSEDVISHLRTAGLVPVCISRAYTEPGPSRRVIQMDGIFRRV
jgi:FkbM family methyltransferase